MSKSLPNELPEAFVRRISLALPDSGQFFEELEGESPTFIRLNSRKISYCSEMPSGETVLWNPAGLKLASRPKFSLEPLYHAGLYYPMEASSMFLEFALQTIDLNPDDLILDLCAAPGGKSLILNDHFPNNILISNEIDRKRAHILKENAIRWGTNKHFVVNSDSKQIAETGLKFALILIDAPCSGEGLFRKDPESRGEWTEERASGCALRQQNILDDVMPLLAPSGTIIYSTCTYNPSENSERLNQLIKNYGLVSRELDVPQEWNIECLKVHGSVGYQFWPHRIEGEGFFIGVLKDPSLSVDSSVRGYKNSREKELEIPDGYLPLDLKAYSLNGQIFAFSDVEWNIYQALKGSVNVVKKGIAIGEFKGKDFIPSHDLSSQIWISSFQRKIELDLDAALNYLRGNALKINGEKGVVVLTFKGLPIGFGKSNGERINNMIPKHLRIF
jgi:16S rRNA C967 or C1407 C5-methylase (RsmB/RsmF family)/NOL1/NOP2/fmu family ribosome biogenesis protein